MQDFIGDDLAKIMKYLKPRYCLKSLYPAHSQSQVLAIEESHPGTVTFIGTTEVLHGKNMSITFTLSSDTAVALINHIRFLDDTAI